MAVFSLPATPLFQTSRFGLRANTQRFASPLDGSVQTLERAGARWFGTFTYPPMLRANAAAIQAFLLKVGGDNRFYAGDPDATTPRGAATGTPVVNGASQTGTSLITDGWTPSVTNILREGDYVAFQNGNARREMHMVVADVNSDGGGNATLTIEPPIRSAPANNETIITASATCEMALISDDEMAWEADQVSLYGITFSGIEVFT